MLCAGVDTAGPMAPEYRSRRRCSGGVVRSRMQKVVTVRLKRRPARIRGQVCGGPSGTGLEGSHSTLIRIGENEGQKRESAPTEAEAPSQVAHTLADRP